MTAKILLFSLVLLVWLGFGQIPRTSVLTLSAEDGVVESLGALAFFVGSAFFLRAFIESRGAGNDFYFFRTNWNLFLLVLALAFFFGAGEEISWGQRLIGWETPPSIAALNAQGETTIHNLEFFQHGISFSFFFNVFWLGFCVVLPILDRWSAMHSFFDQIGLPIVPIGFGFLLVVNYVAFKWAGSQQVSDSELRHAANELKETTIALLFVPVAWEIWRSGRANENGDR